MKHTETYCIGLMSGTSLDGVDIVYCKFIQKSGSYRFSMIACETISYSKEWEEALKNAFDSTKEDLQFLDDDYGRFLGDLINVFIEKYNIKKVDFIASHGHTIFHKPEEGYTLQIGNGKLISEITKRKVICDFRSQDVALGGQGAPLVPIGDALLFSDYGYCLNLGGFANISFDSNGERKAFDICPVNIVMNHYAKKLGFAYDDKGEIASKGKLHTGLLNKLNNLPFFVEVGPKSLGFEFVVTEVLPIIDAFDLDEADVLRTFIAHIVDQIANKIQGNGQLLVTGGGAYNEFLIQQLQNKITNTVVVPKNKIIDFKEALIFAFLGLLKNEGKVNCLKSVTGAVKDHSSGVVYHLN